MKLMQTFAICFSMILAAAPLANGQQAGAVEGAMTIDGQLDEPAWAGAPELDDFQYIRAHAVAGAVTPALDLRRLRLILDQPLAGKKVELYEVQMFQ